MTHYEARGLSMEHEFDFLKTHALTLAKPNPISMFDFEKLS